jgi:GNAT superfamily N-acetyltransferase
MAAVTPPRPLAENDRRSQFDCGRDSLNNWFHQRAWSNHVAGVSRTNVICDDASGEIIGYVTLSAAQIERAFLPKPHQRNKPDPVPVTLLGQLAIHKDHQGLGHARSLLLFALKTAVRASREIGSFGVITHPIDESVRAFYRRWGFEELPGDPRGAMIVRIIDVEASGIVP